MATFGSHTGLINLSLLLNVVDEVANAAVINTALKVHELLRSSPPVGTPIDTGWASANWVLSVDKPVEDTVGSKKSISTHNPGLAEALQFDIRKNTAIYVSNNVPYMARLNRGWSQQSPAGFVEAAIDAATIGMMVT